MFAITQFKVSYSNVNKQMHTHVTTDVNNILFTADTFKFLPWRHRSSSSTKGHVAVLFSPWSSELSTHGSGYGSSNFGKLWWVILQPLWIQLFCMTSLNFNELCDTAGPLVPTKKSALSAGGRSHD